MRTIYAALLVGCWWAASCAEPDPAVDDPDAAPGVDAGDTDTGAPTRDLTFFVLADTHCNAPPDDDQLKMVRAINAVPGAVDWPAEIDGSPTGFTGGPVVAPRGILLAGDITGSGDVSSWNDELGTFAELYERDDDHLSVDYPVYVGLGNHDLDRDDPFADLFREQMWEYVAARHAGTSPPVPVASFDDASRAYSWDWDGVHFVQTHKCATDATHGHPPALDWLVADLAANAADGRPVVLIQHYGFDAFGTQDEWWTYDERLALEAALAPYAVVAIFAGHSHYAMTYQWHGLQILQANDAKAEIGEGNDDGNGSFLVVRITAQTLEAVTCRWLDDAGNAELVPPFVTRPI